MFTYIWRLNKFGFLSVFLDLVIFFYFLFFFFYLEDQKKTVFIFFFNIQKSFVGPFGSVDRLHFKKYKMMRMDLSNCWMLTVFVEQPPGKASGLTNTSQWSEVNISHFSNQRFPTHLSACARTLWDSRYIGLSLGYVALDRGVQGLASGH